MRIVIVACFEGHILLWSHTSLITGLFDSYDMNIMYLSTIILLLGINCWGINCRLPSCTARDYNLFVFASCGSDNLLYSQCKLKYYCIILHCEKNPKKNGKTAKFLTDSLNSTISVN